MKRFDRAVAIVAAVLGGFVAGCAVGASKPYDITMAESDFSPFPWWLTPQWVGVLALVAAVGALALLQRLPVAWTRCAALLGTGVLAAPAIVDISTAQSGTVNGLGAGLIVAAAGRLADGRSVVLLGLIGGLLCSAVFSAHVQSALWGSVERWSVSIGPFYPEPAVPVSVLVVVGVMLLIAMWRNGFDGFGLVAPGSVGVVSLVAAVLLLTYVWLGSTMASVGSWTVAVAVASGSVILVARVLPEGRVVLVGLAVAASCVSQVAWIGQSEGVALGVRLGLVVVGAVVGLRVRKPTPGVVVIALVTASGLLVDWVDGVPEVAYVAVLPLAVGYAVGACVPCRADAVVGAVVPFAMTYFTISPPVPPAEYEWRTNYAYVVEPPKIVIEVYGPLAVGVLVATAVACVAAVAMWRHSFAKVAVGG